jgi:aminopeptidase N
MKRQLVLFLPLFCTLYSCIAQPLSKKKIFTRQDSLRGTIGPQRAWWDVQHYDVSVTPDYSNKTISGKTTIRYKVLPNQTTDYLQVDLQHPLVIDTIYYDHKLYINYPPRPFYNEGNVWHIPLPKAAVNSIHSITLVYHGKPAEAKRPPWDGGWIFSKDEKGNPWMSVACQGLGASSWFPCKDHQSDEPDEGATLSVQVPSDQVVVGNGKLKRKTTYGNQNIYTWEVKNPINSYNIIPYIGRYVSWSDTLMGEKGKLDLTYWVLDYDLEKAKKQFEQVKPTLRAFEHWFGPYPFYEDGFQLVQAPHLGMEHQSAVAYGNKFMNGYLGNDLSGTGWGKKFDFIIVHETGHEWFGNNITTKDIADMWVHEGFTNYSETLFTDYHYGTPAGNEYMQGVWKNIQNDEPIIGPYGVNQEGSGDMYAKGASLVHTIRQLLQDDERFRQLLRGMNKDYYHQTVSSRQVEAYITKFTGKDLSKIFDQYLRTAQIPELQFKIKDDQVSYRWTKCIDGFNMPVRLTNGQWIHPTTKEQKLKLEKGVEVDKNFYINVVRGG